VAGRKIIADTSGIIALLDRDDHYHFIVVEAIRNQQVFVPGSRIYAAHLNLC